MTATDRRHHSARLIDVVAIAPFDTDFEGGLEVFESATSIAAHMTAPGQNLVDEVGVDIGRLVEFFGESFDCRQGCIRLAGAALNRGPLESTQKVGASAVVALPDLDGLVFGLDRRAMVIGEGEISPVALKTPAESRRIEGRRLVVGELPKIGQTLFGIRNDLLQTRAIRRDLEQLLVDIGGKSHIGEPGSGPEPSRGPI